VRRIVNRLVKEENPTVAILKGALLLCEKICEFQRGFAKNIEQNYKNHHDHQHYNIDIKFTE
jgi:hypothetical protein